MIYDKFVDDARCQELRLLLAGAENSRQWCEEASNYLGLDVYDFRDIWVSPSGITYDFTWHNVIAAVKNSLTRRENEIRKESGESFLQLCKQCRDNQK